MNTTIIQAVLFFIFTNGVVCEYCMCVPFWQCREEDVADSKAEDDALDLVDIRAGRSSCTGYFDVCCKIQCGVRGTNNLDFTEGSMSPRILGKNNEAKFGEFPWMLGILFRNNYHCGASLIHPKIALTAAHCLDRRQRLHYKVRAGEWNWQSTSEPMPHHDRSAKKFIIHQNYNPRSLINDIALVVLDRPFQLSENIGIACLTGQNSYRISSNCIATGWGKSSYTADTYQTTLKKVILPIVSRSKCLKTLQEARLGARYALHKSFICAGGEENKDTCKGDGGSPLMCPVEGDDNRYEQIGIVSWGLTCGLKATPGVYVNVALFTNWVDGQLRALKLDTDIYKY